MKIEYFLPESGWSTVLTDVESAYASVGRNVVNGFTAMQRDMEDREGNPFSMVAVYGTTAVHAVFVFTQAPL